MFADVPFSMEILGLFIPLNKAPLAAAVAIKSNKHMYLQYVKN